MLPDNFVRCTVYSTGRTWSVAVVPQSFIPLCGPVAVRDRGSARQTLDILFEVDDFAHRNDVEQVTEPDVRRARGLYRKAPDRTKFARSGDTRSSGSIRSCNTPSDNAMTEGKDRVYEQDETSARQLAQDAYADRSQSTR